MSYKIDWTTLPQTHRDVSLGYGITARVNRINNLVFINQKVNNTQVVPATSTTLMETIPVGFRPSSSFHPTTAAIVGNAPNNSVMGWGIAAATGSTPSSMDLWNKEQLPVPSVIVLTAIWFTDDDWPTV